MIIRKLELADYSAMLVLYKALDELHVEARFSSTSQVVPAIPEPARLPPALARKTVRRDELVQLVAASSALSADE